MPIAKAPQPRASNDNRAALKFISGAGGKAEDEPEIPVTVRVKESVLQQIDASVKTRRVRTPRHAWLLEAVYEKLDREK